MEIYEVNILLILFCLIGVFMSIRKSENIKTGFMSFIILIILLIFPIADFCSYNDMLLKQEQELNSQLKDAIERNERNYDLDKIFEESEK